MTYTDWGAPDLDSGAKLLWMMTPKGVSVNPIMRSMCQSGA